MTTMGLLLLCAITYLFLAEVVSSHHETDDGSEANYYTAAVYEHVRVGNISSDSPAKIVQMNLDYYRRAASVAKSKGADIIVFPEFGIFPPNTREGLKDYLETIPDPKTVSANPCNQASEFTDRPILHTLSCMAKEHSMVVVANTGDIQQCSMEENPNCRQDGVFQFNTNVAFDIDGSLLSRYYKEHLFYEYGTDLPQEPQNPIFSTHIGTFAMYICFDSIFKPMVDAAQKREVDNVILSTMWFDPIPLMTSVQFWQGWAMGNNVTYLVSNVQVHGYNTTGSGVFTGHMGALKYTYNPDGLSKLIVSRAPKSKHQTSPFPNPNSSITVITASGTENYNEEDDGKDVPEFCSSGDTPLNKDYLCMNERTENYTFIKLTEPNGYLEDCNNGMCCSLNYSAESMEENYYFGIYNGTYNMFDHYYWCQENCIVVRCEPLDDNVCGTFPMRSNTVFHKLELKANFTTQYIYPSVLKSGVRLAPLTEWSHAIGGDGNIEGKLKYESDSNKPLLVAGLNGRCYDRDPPYRR